MVKFAVSGQAEITRGEVRGEREMVSLTGIIPYVRGSLALAGVLGPIPPNEGSEPSVALRSLPPLRFFVGGSWPEPVISPVVETTEP